MCARECELTNSYVLYSLSRESKGNAEKGVRAIIHFRQHARGNIIKHMSKQTIVWVIVIVVAAYGIWMVTKNNGSIGPTGDNVSPSPSVSGSSVSSGTKSSSKTTGGGTASGTNVSYSEILSQYKTKTIQFNAQCQATQGQMALSVKLNRFGFILTQYIAVTD